MRDLGRTGRVSVRSCHGPGKSALDAWSIFWFMACFFPTRVPCTAPTSHQLHDILWAELHKWHRQMDPGFRPLFTIKNATVEWTDAPRESFAVARTSRPEQPEALQGFHCENLLFVLDEASGIPEVIFEVAEGALSDENARVLMTSNPTRRTGYFANSHFKMRKHWSTQSISAFDSPRVSQQYIDRMASQYGEDSNIYRVRVLGEFPTEDEDALIPLEWIESAVNRDVESFGEIIWGLDVARLGSDRTVLTKRSSNALLEPHKAWSREDTVASAGRVIREWDDTPETERPVKVYVDAIGVGGGVADILRHEGLPAVDVNVSEVSANEKDRYLNLRTELHYLMREWFEQQDVRIPEDETLMAELSILKMLPPTATGKLRMPQKAEIVKLLELHSSPDVAESFMLTFQHRFHKRGITGSAKRGYHRRRMGSRTGAVPHPAGSLY